MCIPLFSKDPLLRPEARGAGEIIIKELFIKSPSIPLGTSLLGFFKGGDQKGKLFIPVYKTGYSSSFFINVVSALAGLLP